MEETFKIFIEECSTEDVSDWAKTRGFDNGLLKKLKIGKCTLEAWARFTERVSRENIEKAGLFNKNNKPKYFNRIIIPYNDIYFSARDTKSTSQKFKNLFPKGLPKIAYFIKGENKDLFICEGETDLVRIIQEYPNSSVFSLGGCKSKKLLGQMIDRMKEVRAERVIFALDNDEAGKKAFKDFVELLSANNQRFYYENNIYQLIFSEDYKDIDDYFKAGNIKEDVKFEHYPLIKAIAEKKAVNIYSLQDKEELNKNYIFDDNELIQRINHSVGRIRIDGNQVRYFGVRLPVKIISKDTIKIKEAECIVTERGEIFNENLFPKNNEFEFDTKMTLKFNRWDKKSVQDFASGKIQNVTYKEAFEIFKQFYEKNMVFEDPIDYEFNAVWDLMTYHYDIVDKSLIIKKEGVSGSAKSKGMKISSNLSFNGRKWVKPNPSNFFRYRHHNKATIYIEEAERLFDDSKKKQSGDDELVEYLNASYEKGNFVPRQNKDNPNLTDEFDPFGFTQIGSIKPIKGALEKRSITQVMIKASKKDNRGNTEIPSENDQDYSKAREKAYISSLLHYKEFQKNLLEIQNNLELHNREWILARPYIALSKCIDEELSKRIGKYLETYMKIRDDIVIDDASWDKILMDVLIMESSKINEEESPFLSNEVLRNKFNEELSNLSPDSKKVSMNYLSRILSELGLKNYRGRNTLGDIRGLNISFFKLCEILIRNETLKIEEIIKKVSDVSDCQYSVDKINKWYSDTLSDTKKEEVSDKNEAISSDTSDTLLIQQKTLKNGMCQESVSDGRKHISDNLTEKSDIEGIGILQDEEEVIDDPQIIHSKCHMCGFETSAYWDNKAGGKPICLSCYEVKNVNSK